MPIQLIWSRPILQGLIEVLQPWPWLITFCLCLEQRSHGTDVYVSSKFTKDTEGIRRLWQMLRTRQIQSSHELGVFLRRELPKLPKGKPKTKAGKWWTNASKGKLFKDFKEGKDIHVLSNVLKLDSHVCVWVFHGFPGSSWDHKIKTKQDTAHKKYIGIAMQLVSHADFIR